MHTCTCDLLRLPCPTVPHTPLPSRQGGDPLPALPLHPLRDGEKYYLVRLAGVFARRFGLPCMCPALLDKQVAPCMLPRAVHHV